MLTFRYGFLFVMTAAFATSASSQSASNTDLPQFEDYPATDIFQGRPSPVDLSNPDARAMRTRLSEGAAEGPNFAGRLTYVEWGCGSGCQSGAVVDAGTGRVVSLPEPMSNGASFRLDSRLLVLNPLESYEGMGEIPAYYSTVYLVWENNAFRELRTLSNTDIAQIMGLPASTATECEGGPMSDAGKFFDCFRSDYGSGNLGWCDVNLNQSLRNVEESTGVRMVLHDGDYGGFVATATICGRQITLTFDTANRARARIQFIDIPRQAGDTAEAWTLEALRTALHDQEDAVEYHELYPDGLGPTRENDNGVPQYRVGGVLGQTLMLKPDEGVIFIGYDGLFE